MHIQVMLTLVFSVELHQRQESRIFEILLFHDLMSNCLDEMLN